MLAAARRPRRYPLVDILVVEGGPADGAFSPPPSPGSEHAMSYQFNASPSHTLGVEVELQLIDS